jgi:hypothetical protein
MPASYDTVESEGRQMKQKKNIPKNPPVKNNFHPVLNVLLHGYLTDGDNVRNSGGFPFFMSLLAL